MFMNELHCLHIRSDMSPRSFSKINTLLVSKTTHKMIYRHAGGLHEGVNDHRSDEPEPTLHQISANHLCFGASERNTSWIFESVDDGFVAHMVPHVAAEWSIFTHYLHTLLSNKENSNILCEFIFLDDEKNS